MDISTGDVVIFDETMPREVRADVITGSSTMPGILPPVKVGEHMLVDGGTYSDADIGEGIQKCRDFGF